MCRVDRGNTTHTVTFRSRAGGAQAPTRRSDCIRWKPARIVRPRRVSFTTGSWSPPGSARILAAPQGATMRTARTTKGAPSPAMYSASRQVASGPTSGIRQRTRTIAGATLKKVFGTRTSRGNQGDDRRHAAVRGSSRRYGPRPPATAPGLRPTAYGPRPTAHGPRPTAYGPRPTAHGPRPTAYGLRPTATTSAALRSSAAAGWTCPRRSARSSRRGTVSRPDTP